MDNVNRRKMLKVLGAAPALAGIAWTEAEAQQAHQHAQQARKAATTTKAAYKPKFFTAHEYATVTVLANLIIPKDARSGSASDAGVPEFIDFMMVDQPTRQVAMRGGLAWIDQEMNQRVNKTFVAAADADRRALLDDISGVDRVPDGHSHGVAFFRSFRDLTATGFWTSKIGIADLQFRGNTFVPKWNGCAPEALKHLRVSGE